MIHEVCDIDEDEDNYVCENNANDHYRICKARVPHDSVLSKPNTFAEKKPLSATAAPHLSTLDLITKVDDVEMIVGLDVPIIIQKQLKEPVLIILRSWIQGDVSPDLELQIATR